MENNKETPDLDHLKAVWNQDLQRLSDSAEFINRQNLSAMMHQRTHSAIARLKRNLLIEIVSTALMLAAFIAYTLWIGRPVGSRYEKPAFVATRRIPGSRSET